MQSDWHLDEYQHLFETELARALAEHDDRDPDVAQIVEETLKSLLPQITDMLHTALAKRSATMLREHRGLRRGFVRRNKKRWCEAFDLLERLIVISQETGEAINSALRPKAVEENDPVFEAVISNHARAVQVSREIMTLMVAGYPDGALARWRTLHEIAVTSSFIGEHGQETASRYILHHRVNAYKRARNYMAHHERANLEPIADTELADLKAEHDQIVAQYGEEMKSDYGWAAKTLGKRRPNFADLEAATKLEHWRPRYKWASNNTHGAYQTLNSSLGTSESEHPVLLVGESNSGMTDPGHMTAITLVVATMPVIMLEPNVDRLAVAGVMERLTGEIGDTFWRLDQETFQRHTLRAQSLKEKFKSLFVHRFGRRHYRVAAEADVAATKVGS